MRLLSLLLSALLWLLAPSASAQTLTVYAASSLSDAFSEIAERFEGERPGVRVLLNFAGSSMLATQILQGAPADIFASADEFQMARIAADGLLAAPATPFAGNELVLLVAEDGGPTSVAELATPGLLLVLASPEVPAGRYARNWLATSADALGPDFAAAVLSNVVSNEPNVRQAAAKVALGEADAALVYRTDALGLTGVGVVALPGADDLAIRYPIARLGNSAGAGPVDAFIAAVLSKAGQAVLARHGFTTPP